MIFYPICSQILENLYYDWGEWEFLKTWAFLVFLNNKFIELDRGKFVQRGDKNQSANTRTLSGIIDSFTLVPMSNWVLIVVLAWIWLPVAVSRQ